MDKRLMIERIVGILHSATSIHTTNGKKCDIAAGTYVAILATDQQHGAYRLYKADNQCQPPNECIACVDLTLRSDGVLLMR